MASDSRRPDNNAGGGRGPLGLRLLLWSLRLLSPLAPRSLRRRWRREWEGELGHLWRTREARTGPGAPQGPTRHHRNGNRAAAPGTGGTGRKSPGASGSVFGLPLLAARDALHLRFLRGSLGPVPPGGESPGNGASPVHAALLQDLRFGLRTVGTSPGYSLVTALTFALGIGAAVAMFGVLHAAFLRPLPFPEPDRLVVGRATVRGQLNPWVSGADYYDYRDRSGAFRALAAVLPFPEELTFTGRGEAERVRRSVASPNLFSALGARPILGRSFRPEEGLEGGPDVVLVSHGFWLRRLDGDPDAVGTALTLDGNPFTIVGILPPGFHFLMEAEVWLPMRPDRYRAASRDMHNWYLLGRLRPGVTLEQAQADVDVVSARLRDAYPETNQEKALLLTGLHAVLTEDFRADIRILAGAVALVFLIACGNAAGISLARGPSRRFELSVRAAMGAPRSRLVRQLVGESLILSLGGGLLGAALAVWLQRLMLEYLRMERLGLQEIPLSLPVLSAALATSVVTGLLAGAYPALKSTGASLSGGLKSGWRGTGDGATGFRGGLVVAQVALSLGLLTASGLLVRSLRNLETLDPGFRAAGVLTGEIQLPSARYPDAASRERFFSSLLQEASAIPGVESAAITSHLPIGDFGNIYRAGVPGREGEPERIFLRSVFPGYFETLDIPLLSGRGLQGGEEPGGPWVVVLGATAARRLFPDEDPVGKVVDLHLVPNPRPMEVMGVVGDARLSRLEDAPEAAMYVPYAHRPRTVMRMALRIRVPPESVAGPLKEIVRALDPAVPLSRVATLESLVSDSMARRRLVTLSLTLLALLPLFLASVGLFAVLAFHVSRRRHEMGVRMALGGRGAHVGGLILRQGLGLVTVGIGLGTAGSWAGTRLLQGMLFGVAPTDPVTFLSVAALVLAVALAACGIPVWRATRADPRSALQAE